MLDAPRGLCPRYRSEWTHNTSYCYLSQQPWSTKTDFEALATALFTSRQKWEKLYSFSRLPRGSLHLEDPPDGGEPGRFEGRQWWGLHGQDPVGLCSVAIDGQRTMVEPGYRAPGQRSLGVVRCLQSASGKLFGKARGIFRSRLLSVLFSTRSLGRARV